MKNVLVYDVPEDLHRQFKTFCAYKGISMSKVIKTFMQEQIKKIIVKG